MSGRRIVLLGEGERDIGRISDGKRRPPCDFEGDLPRLVRRLAETKGAPPVFSYDAFTIRDIVSRIARAGRPMRSGGKGKDLRDALRTEVVGRLCPKGFAPFATAAEKAIGSVFRLK